MGFEILKNPVFVALDTDDLNQAKKIVDQTYDITGGFKIGPRLVFRYGPHIIKEIAEKAPVFIDFKFYDIPSTIDSAIRSVYDAGATFATVHASAGNEALQLLSKTEKELSKKRPFHILGVTILTSHSQKSLPPHFIEQSIEKQVDQLTNLLSTNGISGVVCSPHELKYLVTKYPKSNFVTPGIRLESDASDDQVRIATPQEAIKQGAAAIVIGRSILNSNNPRHYLSTVLESLN